MKRVSVVIPAYNRAELLRLTINSILSQTIQPFEIIIADDGSTDHTAEICARFPPVVRYIRQENAGVSAARNTAIRVASGDFIAFCDSDDLWIHRKLELQLAAIEATGAGWSLTDFGIIDPDGRRVVAGERGFRLSFPVFSETRLSPEEHLGDWLEERELKLGPEPMKVYIGDAFGMLFLGNIVMPSTAIVARDIVKRTGYFDESFRVAEDTEFFHRVAALSPVAILMEPLSEHRIGHPSLVAENSEDLIQNAIRSVERAVSLRRDLSSKEREAFRQGLQMLRVRLAYARLSALDQKGAREALRAQSRGYIVSPRSIAILFASLLPSSFLRGAHSVKRRLLVSRG